MPVSGIGGPYGTPHMIERQMLFWHARTRAGREEVPGTPPLKYRFVTVSRDMGSLGEEIAQEISGHLGWRIFDQEIVDRIAKDSHVRQGLVQQLDERSQDLVHETVQRLLRMAEGGSFGSEEYHVSLLKSLACIAAMGEAVVVGRGANFALRSQDGFHIRVTASPEVRIERIAAQLGVSRNEARRRMESVDSERRAFIRCHYRREIDDPRGYDLLVSTDSLSPTQVAAAVVTAIACLPASGESAGSAIPERVSGP